MILCANPQAQYEAHKDAVRAAVLRVMDGGGYILGKEVAGFEQAFADYLGVNHGVGVANGTDALILAMRAMDIGPGDEVITVSHTALATVSAVLTTGAKPVLVDIDPVHYTIDPAAAEAAIGLAHHHICETGIADGAFRVRGRGTSRILEDTRGGFRKHCAVFAHVRCPTVPSLYAALRKDAPQPSGTPAFASRSEHRAQSAQRSRGAPEWQWQTCEQGLSIRQTKTM